MAVALTDVVAVFISAIISVVPNKRLIDYRYGEQIKDLLPSIIMSTVMGLAIYPIGKLPITPFVVFVLQVVVGVILYFIMSRLSKNEAFEYLSGTLRSIVKKGKSHD